MLAAVFLAARVGIWHAIGISDAVLIEADRVHALGKKTPAVRIDKPEHAVALVNAKKTASAETVIGNSAPFGSLQADTLRQDNNGLFIAPVGQRILDVSQDRLVGRPGY